MERLVTQDIASLYEFDEWMANVDRHHGNLLLAGSGDMWLIDHGNYITGHMWSKEKLDAAASWHSLLKNVAQCDALGWAARLDLTDPQ
ncbi:hypothetical protein [Ensifer sp. B1-9]|uniref:hypothetical protein n=1 Tax=Ensifer sp. B1-9 TaxID=3141455 RepID=UPI003D23CCC7